MVQVELEECCTLIPKKKIYSIEDIEEMTKPINNNAQCSLNGWSFCSIKNLTEFKWLQLALLDTLNHPEMWGYPGNTYEALIELQRYVHGNHCEKLAKWYHLPMKLQYRNIEGVNAIVDANHNDKIIIPLTARELLDIIAYLNKNYSAEDIYYAYQTDFHHKSITIEHLEYFKRLYLKGELNKLIKFICSKSNELGGFYDYGVEVLRNYVTSRYVFDSRRDGGLNIK